MRAAVDQTTNYRPLHRRLASRSVVLLRLQPSTGFSTNPIPSLLVLVLARTTLFYSSLRLVLISDLKG